MHWRKHSDHPDVCRSISRKHEVAISSDAYWPMSTWSYTTKKPLNKHDALCTRKQMHTHYKVKLCVRTCVRLFVSDLWGKCEHFEDASRDTITFWALTWWVRSQSTSWLRGRQNRAKEGERKRGREQQWAFCKHVRTFMRTCKCMCVCIKVLYLGFFILKTIISF